MFFYFPLLLILAASPAYSMRCLDTTIRTYVRCAQECVSFGDLQDMLNECGRKMIFGCKINRCGMVSFNCIHDPMHPFDICANGVTKFESLDVRDVIPAVFNVDVNAPPRKMQYYFLIDTSGSMAPHLPMVKEKIRELTDMYKTMEGIEAEFSLGTYRDPEYSGTPKNLNNGVCGLNRIRGFTTDIDAFIGDVTILSAASDTHTGPEGFLPSLLQVSEFSEGWNAEARKIIIAVGDAPGYEETSHDLPGSRRPIGREFVANALLRKDISLIAMNIGNPGLDGPTIGYKARTPPKNTGQVSFIAERTGGTVTSPSNTLLEAVIEAKEKHTHEYTLDASDCERHNVEVKVNGESSAFSVSLKPSESSTVTMSLKVNSCFNSFNCTLRFREDGINLMPLTVDFLKVTGCPSALNSIAG